MNLGFEFALRKRMYVQVFDAWKDRGNRPFCGATIIPAFGVDRRLVSVLTCGFGWAVHDLSRLDGCPLVSLDPDAEAEQGGTDDQCLPAHLLTVVHLGLGGPVQELDDILGHLRCCGRSLVLVLD